MQTSNVCNKHGYLAVNNTNKTNKTIELAKIALFTVTCMYILQTVSVCTLVCCQSGV